jgi:hypothetical protein
MLDKPSTSKVFAQGAAERAKDAHIVVILPTYRRPEPLMRTLRSLEAQRGVPPFAIIVIENHAAGMEGARAASQFLAASDLCGSVIVEERQGNCFAYNAGFRLARSLYPDAGFIAVIDDDEVASPHWLAMLVDAQRSSKADIVGGPQIPVFEDREGERRFARHPVFQPAHRASGRVDVIHSTGNCFIAAHVIDAVGHPVLDEAFNFTGGGDTDFFMRCKAQGVRFAWSHVASVEEIMPARRTERAWITARSLRNGMLSALIQRKAMPGPGGRLLTIGKTLALLAASPFRSLLLMAKTGSAYAGSYHMMIAAGRLMAEFGYAQEQYRRPEKN